MPKPDELLDPFRASGGTIEDLARAWASLDGKLDRFDAEWGMPVSEIVDGTCEGYLVEMEEIIRRATE
jgi:hypothetical protein